MDENVVCFVFCRLTPLERILTHLVSTPAALLTSSSHCASPLDRPAQKDAEIILLRDVVTQCCTSCIKHRGEVNYGASVVAPYGQYETHQQERAFAAPQVVT